jgi:hypothetical protein
MIAQSMIRSIKPVRGTEPVPVGATRFSVMGSSSGG